MKSQTKERRKRKEVSIRPLLSQPPRRWIADEIADEVMRISNGLWSERENFVRNIYRDGHGDFHRNHLRENIEAIEKLEIELDNYNARIEGLLNQLRLRLEYLYELLRRE